MTSPEETSKNPSLYKTLRSRIVEIQPSTPAKISEEPQSSIMSSDSPPPPPDRKLDSLESPSTTPPPRRSSRLAAIPKPLYSGRRSARQTGSSESPDKGNKSEELVDDSRVLDSKRPISSLSGPVEEASTPKARRTLKPAMVDLTSSEDVTEEGMRKIDIDLNLPAEDPEAELKDKGGFLYLRSGARIIKKKMEGTGVCSGGFGSDGVQLPFHQLGGEGTDGEEQVRLSNQGGEGVGVENFEKDPGESSGANGGKRYSAAEKGKGTLIRDAPVELNLFPVTERLMKDAVSGLSQQYEKGKMESPVREYKGSAPNYRKERIKKTLQYKKERRSDRTESFRRAARENASRFAHFRPEEENNPVPNVPERQMPPVQTSQELEDWPGPFSTAMKIIKERNMKQSIIRPGNSSSGSREPEIEWQPAKGRSPTCRRPPADSLRSLCLRILAKNADKIASLEYVPDSLKYKLTRLVCDSRKMSNDYMRLVFCGSPTEIRVDDCSSITEEELCSMLQGCKTENLMVLQLDFCGRCLPNYVLRTMVAQSPNGLCALTNISLKGACRLSDVGLKALVASAPALMSINLGMCSFVTLDSINILGDSLRSSLRKLYIDDCQNVDAMTILPALKKLTHLEVLSVARVPNVCDDFVSQLVAVHGPNMKELCFSGCRELTDTSLKATAETCSKLCCLDIGNLRKLTDRALGYIAYGCQSIQTLNLYRSAFSDEAIAAFLEASGESLTELWLNNVNEVSHHTAISLARRSRKLRKLDLSFCRKLTDKALGLIVDNCSELKLLKLFGCTQIGEVFLCGHSNPHVEIVGLPLTDIYKHLNYLDTL